VVNPLRFVFQATPGEKWQSLCPQGRRLPCGEPAALFLTVFLPAIFLLHSVEHFGLFEKWVADRKSRMTSPQLLYHFSSWR
jgi:hypothetical protein